MITIHYDFSTGEEISYIEGKEKKDNFKTHCFDFFSFDLNAEVKVLKKDGTFILKSKLLEKNNNCIKEIRKEHNIKKMLVANKFIFNEKN